MSKVIMTVDDSKSIRQMVGFTLSQAGYSVVEACDGLDALEKLKSSPVNMIITDINMPNLNGIGLIGKVRQNPSYRFIPIVALTTESQDTKKMEAKQAGATGWIVKPFSPDQLLAVVKKVLR
ncbi:MAG: response regulator [Calditrichia bacterium]|nr:response regulator [Calditrichota bacterium]MCB0270200.1 response regulator [Calditrichota bacterium]MCB9066823.1 response regulator [Calditrichia bacterium]